MNDAVNHSMPPRVEEVEIYFLQKGIPRSEAHDFFLLYNARQWQSRKGNAFRNWKGIAHAWITSVLSAHPWLRKRGIN